MEIKIESLNKFGSGINIQQSQKSIEKEEEEFFYSIIERLGLMVDRSSQLINMGIESIEYESGFYAMIEDLLFKYYGPTQSEIICWWVYERQQMDDKSPVYLINSEGEKTQIKTVKQLYKFITKLKK